MIAFTALNCARTLAAFAACASFDTKSATAPESLSGCTIWSAGSVG